MWIIAGLVVTALALLAAAGAVTHATGRGKRNGAHVLWFRWLSGGELDGKPRTNATWTQPADKVLHPGGRVHRWHRVRRWRRSAVRTGIAVLLPLTGMGLLAARRLTVILLLSVTISLGAWGAVHAANRIRRWPHHRHYVRPLERTLVKRLGVPVAALKVERDGGTVKSVAIEWAPETELTTEDQQMAISAVTTRLAIEAPVATWKLKGRSRSVVLTQSEPAPFPVSWEDVVADIDRTGANDLVFGLGKGAVPVRASYSGDSPHLAISGGSGGGKSNLAAFLLLQEMRRGSLIFNLDPKWISHLWLQNLPNVINAHEIPALHLALTWLGKELLRRTKAAYYSAGGTGRVRASVGPRIIVMCEELNYGMQGLKDHWREIRSKEDPKRSPALTGLAALSCAGRASDMHEWLMAQLLTAASTGVSDSTIRTNAGIKCMVRYEPSGWNMVVGKHVPMPPQPTVPGRLQLVTAGIPRETQPPYLHLDDKDEEVADRAVSWAREYAVSGTVAQIPTGREGIPRELWPPCVVGQALPSIDAGQGPETVGHVPGLPPLMSLRRACAEGILKVPSIDAARKAAQRPGFPAVAGWDGPAALYHTAELKAFTEGKVRILR